MESARCAFGLEIRTDGIQIRDAIFNCSITRYIRISRFNERRIRIERIESKTIFSFVIISKIELSRYEGKVNIEGKRVDPKYLKSFQSLLRTLNNTINNANAVIEIPRKKRKNFLHEKRGIIGIAE